MPSMDARFADSLTSLEHIEPVVVSVDYSLAPETPFSGAVEDAAAAITWLAENAHVFGLDPKRIVLTGFSAGGSLVFAAPIWMHDSATLQILQAPLKGIISIYPGVDWRNPRQSPPQGLARFMTECWEDAFYRRSPTNNPLVSIAAADDTQLGILPQRIGLYPVDEDPLKHDVKQLRQRLERLGKKVTGMTESGPGSFHGFDKMPVKGPTAWQKRQDWHHKIAMDVAQMLSADDI